MIINPIQVHKEEDEDLLKTTLNDLVEAFSKDLKAGKVKFKSVTEFIRLATLLYQLRGDLLTEDEVVVLPKLDKKEEGLLEELYQSLVETSNWDHDEKNRGKQWP